MRVVRGVLVISSLVVGVVISLGEVAKVVDRAGAVPFDGDVAEPEPAQHWSLPFESRAV